MHGCAGLVGTERPIRAPAYKDALYSSAEHNRKPAVSPNSMAAEAASGGEKGGHAEGWAPPTAWPEFLI
jgi:hypothetical protein